MRSMETMQDEELVERTKTLQAAITSTISKACEQVKAEVDSHPENLMNVNVGVLACV